MLRFSVKYIDPVAAEYAMLKNCIYASKAQLSPPDMKMLKERGAKMQELLYFCAATGELPMIIPLMLLLSSSSSSLLLLLFLLL